jgi:hypothetical protein
VPVSERVYRVYYKARRHERHLEEKDAAHRLIHYAALNTYHSTGEERIPDTNSESVVDIVMRRLMIERLYKCLALLTVDEQVLIEIMFFQITAPA